MLSNDEFLGPRRILIIQFNTMAVQPADTSPDQPKPGKNPVASFYFHLILPTAIEVGSRKGRRGQRKSRSVLGSEIERI